MRTADVEIYSDRSNQAVMRHPGRRFPGVLIQGDSLHNLCQQADRACAAAAGRLSADDYDELTELQDLLRSYLDHYKAVLAEHGMELPFGGEPDR